MHIPSPRLETLIQFVEELEVEQPKQDNIENLKHEQCKQPQHVEIENWEKQVEIEIKKE